MPAPVDPQVRAAALADVLAGMSVNAAAKKHQVARKSITDWLLQSGLSAPVTQPSVRAQIWEAVDRYLLEALETLRAQVKIGRDEAWIKSNDTAGLAALHNAIAEKVARLVEAEEAPAVEQAAPVDIRSRAR